MQTYFKNIYEGVVSLIIGMRASFRHFKNKKDLVATLQYPHETWPIPERNIGFKEKEYNLIRSRLHVDIDDCIGCLQCERACPVDCIKIDNVKPPKGSDYDCGITSNDTQKKMVVARFTIDMAECCYCNLCVYPCPEECIYMVGGPNSHKHDMDYEFGKYQRDGLLYEFSEATDEEIISAGGEAYLKKRNERSGELENALELVAMAAEKAQEEVDSTATKSDEKVVKPAEPKHNFDALNKIEDKPTRGLAKRAFVRGLREKLDSSGVADLIKSDLEKLGKFSSEFDGYIEEVRNSQLLILPEGENPEEIKSDQIEETKKPEKNESAEAESSSSESELNIKMLDGIADKMARGVAKKAFMAAKRASADPVGYADGIKNALVEAGKWDDSFEEVLISIKQFGDDESGAEKKIKEVAENPKSNETVKIPDIKILNDIEDKMARGIAKKAFMGAKRQKLSSGEYVTLVENALQEADKLTDDIKYIIQKIGK